MIGPALGLERLESLKLAQLTATINLLLLPTLDLKLLFIVLIEARPEELHLYRAFAPIFLLEETVLKRNMLSVAARPTDSLVPFIFVVIFVGVE